MSVDVATPPREFGGRFQVLALAGEGSGGVVYRALDQRSGDVVAVKVLQETEPAAIERFEQEALLLASLGKPGHPGIVRYLDHGTASDGMMYLAMEWLEGETLEDRLARGPLGTAEVAALGARLFDALAAAHRKGIVHRDLKPSNLFLVHRQPAEAKLLDFGVARRLFEAKRTTVVTGVGAGTPLYMSPEQARGEDVDARSDLFSAAAVLFECLTGQPAFLGETEVAILAKICLDDSVDVRARCPGVPLPLADLLQRLLAKDRTQRPAAAGPVASEFGAVLDRLSAERRAARTGPRRTMRTPTPPLTVGEHRAFSAVLVSRLGGRGPDALDGVRRAMAAFGANVDRLRDGSLVVTLVGRGTPTDQAVGAARCALLLKDLLPDCAFAVGTGRADVRVHLPIGGVLEGAASMLSGELAGRIRVDPATAHLVDSRFEVEARGDAVYLLYEKGLREHPRTVLGREIPCVGRDRELSLLDGLHAECVAEPVARAVLVTAPAGGGKSRVRHAFLERVANRGERFELLAARGDAMRAGSPFGLLGPAVRAAANVGLGDPVEVQRVRLAAHIGRRLSPDAARRVAPFIGELAGVPFPDGDLPALAAARRDPRLMADQVLAAWLDWLEAELAHGPVVLVLEDLQWGDVPSVQLVDAALRTLRERPLMVLAFARPEVDETFPLLWSDRDLQRMSLAPLGPRSATKLLRSLLGDVTLSDERVAWIVERSEGNPFFLEEIARAVASGELTAGGEVPDTVLGVVQTRLDALGDQGKRVLRAASIYGLSFRRSALAALLGEDGLRQADDWLPILVEREILFPAGRDDELTFRQALVRDAAYDMLPQEDLRNGHRVAGEWLENAGERDAIVLVEHFERAQRPLRAAHHCRAAAAQAMEANDLGGAVQRAERGVRNGATGETLGLLRLLEAQARYWRGEYAQAARCAEQASTLTTGAPRLDALGELMASLGYQTRYDEVVACFEQVAGSDALTSQEIEARTRCLLRAGDFLLAGGRYAHVERLLARAEFTAETGSDAAAADPLTMARQHHLAAMFLSNRQTNPAASVEHYTAALATYREMGALREQQVTLTNLGAALFDLGQLEQAEARQIEVRDAAERLGLAAVTISAQMNLGLIWLQQPSRFADAAAALRRVLSAARSQGDRRAFGFASTCLARVLLGQGRNDDAEAAAATAVESLRDTLPLLPTAMSVLAQALRAQGRIEEAASLAAEAYALLESQAAVEDGEALVRLAHAECLDAAGNHQAARAVLAKAVTRLHQRASAIEHQPWADSFLERLIDHRRTLELARAWSTV